MSAPEVQYDEGMNGSPLSGLTGNGVSSTGNGVASSGGAGGHPDVEAANQHNVVAISNASLNSAASRARATLEELDSKKLSLFHIKTILIAGSGFLCDGYDLQVIGMITNLMGRIYYPDWTYWSPTACAAVAGEGVPSYLEPANQANNSKYLKCGSNFSKLIAAGYSADGVWEQHVPSAMPLPINFAIVGVALCGTLTGQLLFGKLGDVFGRRRMFIVSLAIMILFAFMQGLTLGEGPGAFVWSLCWFRFMLGVGIGGDYPLSAVLMSEYGGRNNRGALVAAVFAQQGTGYLLASGTVAMFAAIWKASGADVDYLWRIVLMFGCIPTLASMYSRITMPESPRYTLFNQGNAGVMVSDMKTVLVEGGNAADAERMRAQQRLILDRHAANPDRVREDERTYSDFFRQYGLILIGTAGSWFMLDIAFYSQGLYQNVIYQNIGWVAPSYTLTPADEALQLAKAQSYVNLASTVPGYWFTVFTIEIIGRWWIQFVGFLLMALFNSILSGDYNNLYYNQAVFIGLYCMTFFFANWGPNATTFVVPAEVFPSKFRSFGHGFSAACGKAGSIIGTFGFKYMTLYTGDQLPARGSTPAGQSLGPALGLLSGVLGLGALLTLLVPEGKGKSLEELGSDSPVDYEYSETQASKESDGIGKGIDYYATHADGVDDSSYINGNEATKPQPYV